MLSDDDFDDFSPTMDMLEIPMVGASSSTCSAGGSRSKVPYMLRSVYVFALLSYSSVAGCQVSGFTELVGLHAVHNPFNLACSLDRASRHLQTKRSNLILVNTSDMSSSGSSSSDEERRAAASSFGASDSDAEKGSGKNLGH